MITCVYLQWPTINDDIAIIFVVCSGGFARLLWFDNSWAWWCSQGVGVAWCVPAVWCGSDAWFVMCCWDCDKSVNRLLTIRVAVAAWKNRLTMLIYYASTALFTRHFIFAFQAGLCSGRPKSAAAALTPFVALYSLYRLPVWCRILCVRGQRLNLIVELIW